jgi:hypothetical protein
MLKRALYVTARGRTLKRALYVTARGRTLKRALYVPWTHCRSLS